MFAIVATFLWCEPVIDKILSHNYNWNILLLPFRHSNWLHVIGNLECFFIVSLYLERKFGSFRYFFVILFTIPISPLLRFILLSSRARGESLVNFFLFGIFFVDIFFNFRECFLTKYHNIFVIITILLIFMLMSFTMNIEFKPFVTLLEISHGSAFIEGVVIGIFSNLIVVKNKRSN